MKDEPVEILWLEEPEDHDYPAARNYLQLHYSPARARELVHRLHAATVTEFKAKDICRAAALPLLGISNSHVEHNRQKIFEKTPLSPVLLIRREGDELRIADGYHRVCAIYSHDEDAPIHCKIIGENDDG